MIFVFDTNAFAVLKNFYPATFAGLWKEIDGMVAAQELVSVEEVYNECQKRTDSEHILNWIERNKHIFTSPTEEEMEAAAEIFSVKHFQQLVTEEALLRGGLVADPWLIAKARTIGGTVVTEEKLKPNAAKIPNVCDHFKVPCTNVEGLLKVKGWKY